jgi:hypothetical protein
MQPTALCGDRQVAIAEPAHQVKRLLRRLLLCEPQRVLRHVLLDDRPHVRRCAEKPVRGHQPRQRLVRPLEVVPLHEEGESALAVREVRKHRPRQKLVPQRLPKPLDLPERLRVLRAALHVPYPMKSQLLLEVRLSPPRRVLPPLVRQDLLRLSVRGNPALEGLHHELRPLMVRQPVRHDEARVVVHEGREVQPLVAPQQKREDVRLPELVRLRPLEAPRRVLSRSTHRPALHQPRLVQDPPHLRLRHAQRLEARQRVPDPPRPVLRVRFPHRHDRVPLHRLSR